MQALTTAMLAERWLCSERHIRNMITSGELPAFRLGKLFRIRLDDVERVECQTGDLHGSKENTASHGTTQMESGDVIDLEQKTKQRRTASPRLDTRNSHARAGRQ